VDDPESGNFESQLTAAARGVNAGTYTVLLSHRPELFSRYAARNFDLVLAGHAHGGLWRIPWILNGVVAPNQGFFPKYTSGWYHEGATTMIVSRGLARESTLIPRFCNRVELVTIDLLPPETTSEPAAVPYPSP
jgi:predicted MPP superfamily phosphohydrolase